MTERGPLAPRIYQLRAAVLGPVLGPDGKLAETWLDALGRASQLGFGHVLVEAAALAEIGAAVPALAEAARGCRLGLYVDCMLEGQAPAPDPVRVLDPRSLSLAETEAAASSAARAWAESAAAWHRQGVDGFLLRGLQAVPFERLRAGVSALRQGDTGPDLLAWTPGVSRETVRALRGLGCDYVFSSLAWWDFRDAWLLEEWRALEQAGAVLAFPADPYGQGSAGVGVPDAAIRGRAALRALWAAAACGAGWLVPMDFERQGLDGRSGLEPLDLGEAIRAANRWLARQPAGPLELLPLSGGYGEVAALLRSAGQGRGRRNHLLLLNANLTAAAPVDWAVIQSRLPDAAAQPSRARASAGGVPGRLEAGAVAIVELGSGRPVLSGQPRRKSLTAALAAPRVAIESVGPVLDGGRFAVKRTPGEALRVQADIFMDGHDKLAASLLWRSADEESWSRVPMAPAGNDRWEGVCRPQRVGMGYYAVQAWRDTYATFTDELRKKSGAGQDVAVELEEVRAWVGRVLEGGGTHADPQIRGDAREALAQLPALQSAGLLAWLFSPEAEVLMRALDPREFCACSAEMPVRVERRKAQFSSWYELFPRSQSGDAQRHGTFADVIARLPAVRAMGFDVLYFPPIHPIGRKNRKGRNNSLAAGPDDPGSPYAIGSEAGGHDAIHPELGTLEDFRALVEAAGRQGLEIALDFAIQCSPDHPWLAEHPDWFAWRADGSLRYAENPPKKYEDIVNVDFYARGRDAAPGLWLALLDVVLFWAREGVRIFRVDNPHTKPLPFWEWLIAQVHARHPDAVFLSEAFTRPKMMYRLAKLGFSQSYTYFTWREHKRELTEYLEEISRPPVSDLFRPNFFVNTPDINPRFLQVSGRAGFLIRAALAATMAGSWGVYSGFELCEAAPVPGKEEYLDSEKYEIRAWDWQRPGNIVAEVAALNGIRRDNPALHIHTGIDFLNTDNDQVLAYTRSTPEHDNVVLVVVSLDPHGGQGAHVELPLWTFGLPDDGSLHAEDLLHGYRFDWHGKMQYVWLEPHGPYAIWRIGRKG
ncbi:Alpha-1,4-glucan:maltose-1-phosphate maltosyltransferase 1 [Pigmentiphaga humi]|uniref:Alpha-1,4-glucan:maltose-1-phosphate maltosyltransferase n=1 Tax=Pigmentiphaga humi TaxID=2478468 RepID=A0A3P4B5E6_9BURK|nr:alpha-1,4-glucan--maltose-1-phosphate maltosyltransferase [Pigmentiphaga humi]VCU70756.1 Alpha-1,4-glucan:maltose-1-phosphate maltosyltransferase 1 [Pigmentiphaga humi]